jgi:hypothetical protein
VEQNAGGIFKGFAAFKLTDHQKISKILMCRTLVNFWTHAPQQFKKTPKIQTIIPFYNIKRIQSMHACNFHKLAL